VARDPQGRLHSRHSRHEAERQDSGRKYHSNVFAAKNTVWAKENDHKVSNYANISDGQTEQIEQLIRAQDTGLLTAHGMELKVR
jgi:hypothetical protein